MGNRIVFFANTDWYLYNFRRGLAERLRSEGWEVVLVAPGGTYGQKLGELGFRFVSFDFSTRSTNPLAELGVLLRLIRLYRALRPTLAHHFTIKCVLYGTVAARIAGVGGIVNAVTGLGHIFTDRGLRTALLRGPVRLMYKLMLAGRKVRVIFQNEEDRGYFLHNHLVSRERTAVIRGSGVDCELFSPGHENGDLPAGC